MFTKFKKLLASRKLFSNWLTAGVKYYLASRGLIRLKNIEVVCRSGGSVSIPLKTYNKLINDFYEGFLEQFDVRNATYLGAVKVPVDELDKSDNVGRAIAHGWSFNGKYWFKGNVKFVHMHGTILNIFEHGKYAYVDVNGKVVVDVGAYVGDSAIYFALRGARKVIAIEPHPIAYTEMIENIKLNSFENVIIPVNAGLASRSGNLTIENIIIPMITLGDILHKYNVPKGSILKMDCYGCEYDVILNSYEHLRIFEEIIIRYYSNIDPLLRVLSGEYECNIQGNLAKCIKRQA